jgi:hypothetical protein
MGGLFQMLQVGLTLPSMERWGRRISVLVCIARLSLRTRTDVA